VLSCHMRYEVFFWTPDTAVQALQIDIFLRVYLLYVLLLLITGLKKRGTQFVSAANEIFVLCFHVWPRRLIVQKKCSTKFAKGALLTFIMHFGDMSLPLLCGFEKAYAISNGTSDANLNMLIAHMMLQHICIFQELWTIEALKLLQQVFSTWNSFQLYIFQHHWTRLYLVC